MVIVYRHLTRMRRFFSNAAQRELNMVNFLCRTVLMLILTVTCVVVSRYQESRKAYFRRVWLRISLNLLPSFSALVIAELLKFMNIVKTASSPITAIFVYFRLREHRCLFVLTQPIELELHLIYPLLNVRIVLNIFVEFYCIFIYISRWDNSKESYSIQQKKNWKFLGLKMIKIFMCRQSKELVV